MSVSCLSLNIHVCILLQSHMEIFILITGEHDVGTPMAVPNNWMMELSR